MHVSHKCTFISLIFLCVCFCHILWVVSVAILPQAFLQFSIFVRSALAGEPCSNALSRAHA
uniref:Uncharacterized protein n=1 Tax=Octopus bimaculoides TaxID=37653 RepID=A0A0L8HFR4_OCTBM